MRARTLRLSCLALLLPLAGACADEPAGAVATSSLEQACVTPEPEPPLYPAGQTLFGKTPGEWTAAWWQWSLAIQKIGNPMRGGPCDQNQSGDVFFLAGNFGGVETRTCEIPSGKALYFPIINMICRAAPEASCAATGDLAELTACSRMGEHVQLSLTIDGVAIEGLTDYRADSDIFNASVPAERAQHVMPCIGPIRANTCGVEVGSERPIMTDGYWVMVRPLAPGPHTLRFVGVDGLPPDAFSLDVTYNINVTPEPEPEPTPEPTPAPEPTPEPAPEPAPAT